MANNIIEMDDLTRLRSNRSTSAEAIRGDKPGTEDLESTNGVVTDVDGSVSVWAWTSSAILGVFSTCLLLFPRFLLFLAEPSGGRGTLTALEKYLSLQLGVVFGTLSITVISTLPHEWPTRLQHQTRPSNHPLLRPMTVACLGMAWFSLDNGSVGTLATAVLLGSSLLGLLGLWILVFAGPSSISRKTGADKHTSAFIFGNQSAASVRKRLWKRDQRK